MKALSTWWSFYLFINGVWPHQDQQCIW